MVSGCSVRPLTYLIPPASPLYLLLETFHVCLGQQHFSFFRVAPFRDVAVWYATACHEAQRCPSW